MSTSEVEPQGVSGDCPLASVASSPLATSSELARAPEDNQLTHLSLQPMAPPEGGSSGGVPVACRRMAPDEEEGLVNNSRYSPPAERAEMAEALTATADEVGTSEPAANRGLPTAPEEGGGEDEERLVYTRLGEGAPLPLAHYPSWRRYRCRTVQVLPLPEVFFPSTYTFFWGG